MYHRDEQTSATRKVTKAVKELTKIVAKQKIEENHTKEIPQEERKWKRPRRT
ncbi:hypothetical protein CCACVL1_02797, partial [Corchorus capsularis]